MSSKELLAVLCLLEKMSDTAKMECLTFLRLLRENEEMKLLAASSHQTSQKRNDLHIDRCQPVLFTEGGRFYVHIHIINKRKQFVQRCVHSRS